MAGRKNYEMQFQLNANLCSSYSKTFRSAQQELSSLAKEIKSLSSVQSDIAAYQKQQSAISATERKLSALQQQYDNIQREIAETEGFSSALENKLISKQLQIDRTSASLDKQTQKLDEMGNALQEAGVDTDNLSQTSATLADRLNTLRNRQDQVADGAQTFGVRAGEAFNAVHEAIVAAGIATSLKEMYRGFADCAQASMDFESAITGVAKTTDLTDTELADISDALKDMSTEMPATAEELAAIAESAGQLGIQKNSLLDFTEIMAMLGTSTNMSADEAATALARFANITGTSADNYGRLGSVIVDLGNKFATTESEITAMATRLASAGTLAGLTEADIMALSAAMSSVGIEAEAGGTAMTQTLSAIESAVANGGDTLSEFARIAGMTADEFSDAWETNAISALTSFISGLGQLESQGESAVLTLDELGLSGIRQSNMLQSLALAADKMGSAVDISNQAWAENTALTNEASKRYATTQSQLTMMQNAYNNLEVAIGDAYNPALQKSFSIGTKVLKNVTEFVEMNPELVNGVTAFAGVMGVATVGVTGYTAVVKLATVAQQAFAAVSSVSLGTIFGVTAAIGGAVAVIAALATAAENDAIPSVEELTEAARGMDDALGDAKATLEDSTAETLAAAEVADTYITKLEEMGDYASLSADEQQRYRNTLSLLCEVVPELSGLIDVQTGAIDGGTDALRANTEAWKQNAKQQAYQEYKNTLMEQYKDVLVEAAANNVKLTQAEYALDAAQQKQADAIDRINELYGLCAEAESEYGAGSAEAAEKTSAYQQEIDELTASLPGLQDEVSLAQDSVDAYSQAIADGQEATESAEQELESAEQAINDLTAATERNADVTAEDAAQMQDLQSAVSGVSSQMSALADAYTEAYNAAYESISGQYELWDQVSIPVATSADSINSALQSQITYWQDYNENLLSLRDRAADIEGLSTMIDSFADGSEESVSAIAGMAGATDSQLQQMVSNWQTLQAEQKTTADSMADLQTNFTNSVNQMQQDFAKAVADMNLSAEARKSGEATLQGFISAANSMLPQVQAAYARVANAAKDALSVSVGGGEIRGYAVGTRSAEEGFAMVGENGPELVYFNGGEQVLTASETAALKSSLSPAESQLMASVPHAMGYMMSAQSSPLNAESSGGETIFVSFAPQYSFGNVTDTAKLESILYSHDEEMRDFILQVLEEAGVDAARRSYL